MKADLLKRNSYHYELPAELIAQYPAQKRDESRLMHLQRGDKTIDHKLFSDLPDLLREGDLLVLNNSKVFPARLFGEKANGTKIEVLLLSPDSAHDTWKCLVYPGKSLKEEQYISFSENMRGYVFSGANDGTRLIRLEYEGDFWVAIDKVGHIPLPPYINRPDEDEDRERYQTIYAREPGSVAAPTAGLHFSPVLMDTLKAKGVQFAELTLHVGIGTFRPVKTDDITQHLMHSECVEIPETTAELVNCAKQENRRVIAVGSTSVRSLESFWEDGRLQAGNRWTDIFIYPGYNFKVADAMITNFHLPESTLLMMISAFAGYDFVMEAYRLAVSERYRFFSYGDAMLIEL